MVWNHSLPIKPKGSDSGSEDSKKGHSWTWHGIPHILSSQRDQSGSEDSEKRHRWTWHGITHILSSQQDQNGSEDSEKRHSCISKPTLICPDLDSSGQSPRTSRIPQQGTQLARTVQKCPRLDQACQMLEIHDSFLCKLQQQICHRAVHICEGLDSSLHLVG